MKIFLLQEVGKIASWCLIDIVSFFYIIISSSYKIKLLNACNKAGKNISFNYSVGVKHNTLIRNYELQKQEESFQVDLSSQPSLEAPELL